ncbi:MAG: hypothetical protein KC505_02155 [Myxococcales bacterium]|nr:hypothetical protein [Myxococcales bacterium]USN51329.1 MAG: hypothetical protein H6731_02675 [Myxococcales bacterium]
MTTRNYEAIPEDNARKIIDLNHKQSSHKPKIAIVSHYTTDKDNLGFIDLVTKNHIKYARMHGYDYYFRNGTISDKYFWPDGKNRTFKLGLYWQKIQASKELLEMKKDGKPLYDYVMWLDTDAIFTNLSLTLEKIINQAPKDTYFFIGQDMSSCVNAGVFITKNSDKGRAFINAVDSSFEIYKMTKYPEQLAMSDLVYGYIDQKQIDELHNKPLEIHEFVKKVEKHKCTKTISGIQVLSMKLLNGAYPWPDAQWVSWDKNSLIAHFLSISGPRLERYLKTLLGCLEQNNYENRNRCNPYNLNIVLR